MDTQRHEGRIDLYLINVLVAAQALSRRIAAGMILSAAILGASAIVVAVILR